MNTAEKRVVEAAIDAYRGFYNTITQNNLANATRTLLGGELQPDDRVLTADELAMVLRDADARTVWLLYSVSDDSQERVLREALGKHWPSKAT